MLSPGPPLNLYDQIARLHILAALVAEGSFESPHKAEAPLCKVAATFPLQAVLQPR